MRYYLIAGEASGDLHGSNLIKGLKAEDKAWYGKIYGDMKIWAGENYSVNGVSFRYYLNPNPLDRNLEWDMKTNLCPNPGSLGQLQP